MRKFVVIAAQSVTTKNPSLRTMNLILRPCRVNYPSGRHPLGLRWSSMTPQSGTS
jgi:hypothetical protein